MVRDGKKTLKIGVRRIKPQNQQRNFMRRYFTKCLDKVKAKIDKYYCFKNKFIKRNLQTYLGRKGNQRKINPLSGL